MFDPPPPITGDSSQLDLLRAAAVATVLNVTTRTLRRWETRGLLTPVRVGRTVFYRGTDIRALITGGLVTAAIPAARQCALNDSATMLTNTASNKALI
jgi:hypothetical protein